MFDVFFLKNKKRGLDFTIEVFHMQLEGTLKIVPNYDIGLWFPSAFFLNTRIISESIKSVPVFMVNFF